MLPSSVILHSSSEPYSYRIAFNPGTHPIGVAVGAILIVAVGFSAGISLATGVAVAKGVDVASGLQDNERE
jgi:hypothetical protein